MDLAALRTASYPRASATVAFDDNGNVPELIEKLATFGNAKIGYQKIVSHLLSCKQLSGTSSGQKFSGTVGQASFPHYGNASAAFEAHFAIQGESLGEVLVIVRMGNIVMGIAEGDLAPVDTDQFQGFVKKALAKLPVAPKITTSTVAPAPESTQVTWCKLTIGEAKSQVLAEMGPPHGNKGAAMLAPLAKAYQKVYGTAPDYAEWDVDDAGFPPSAGFVLIDGYRPLWQSSRVAVPAAPGRPCDPQSGAVGVKCQAIGYDSSPH